MQTRVDTVGRSGDLYEDDKRGGSDRQWGLLGGPDILPPEDDVLGGSDPSPGSVMGSQDPPVAERGVFGGEQSINVDLLASPYARNSDLLASHGARWR
jgi:hypothetical protein